MANKLYEESNIQAIADAIRVQNGTQETYTVAEMSDAIMAIQGGLSDDVKEALLNCFAHVAWIDENGQDYYDALENSLYPPVELSSISAVYTQSGTVYDNASLDDLKSDLVVTAHYSDSSFETVTSYLLSGTLTAGTSTITVTYEDKTTTFNVTVTERPTLSSISAVYTQSGTVYDTDTLDSLKTDLVVTAHYSDSSTDTVASSDYTLSGTLTVGTSVITVTYEEKATTFSVTVTEKPLNYTHVWDFTQSLEDTVGDSDAVLKNATRDSSGLHLSSATACCFLGSDVYPVGSCVEVDFASTSANLGANHGRLMMINDISNPTIDSPAVGNGFIYRSTGAWNFYHGGWGTDLATTDPDVFNGKTLKMKYYLSDVDSKVHTDVYADDTFIGGNTGKWNNYVNPLYIGSTGNSFNEAVITAVRIYPIEE